VTDVRDVIIIGSGPAGYTAAIYTARAKLQPLVLAGSVTAGGALMQTTDVENFPGFPDGIMGPNLMEELQKQAERFGAEVLFEDAIEVDLKASPKVVKTDSETYLAKAVIIATGSKYKELGVPGEKELSGHGVSWCATRFGKSVTLVHRRDKLRASKIMQERAFANPKIKFQWDSEPVAVEGEGKASGLRVRNVHSGEETVLPVDGIFIAIGHKPRSELFAGQLPTNPDGYLEVEGRSTRTAIEGVFACGDVVDHVYRQAITAAGSGCSAAIDAERWLAEHEHANA
jgi:thioredoxin reductase (NADPH)